MYCPNCRAEMPDDSAFCPACGSNVQQSTTASNQQFSQQQVPPHEGGYQQQGYMNQKALRQVQTGLPIVGVGPRAVAVIIDAIIFVVIYYIMLAFFGGTSVIDTGYGMVEYNTGLTGIPALLYFLIALAYYIVLEGKLGATVGKMLLGLKVVAEDGSPITYKEAAIRTLLRIIDGLFVYLVGAILVWTSPSKQRLGDRAAHTLVVRAQKTGAGLAIGGISAGQYGNQQYDNFSNNNNFNNDNSYDTGATQQDDNNSSSADSSWDSNDSGNDSGGSND